MTLLPPDGALVHWLGVHAGVHTAYLSLCLSMRVFSVAVRVKDSSGFAERLRSKAGYR